MSALKEGTHYNEYELSMNVVHTRKITHKYICGQKCHKWWFIWKVDVSCYCTYPFITFSPRYSILIYVATLENRDFCWKEVLVIFALLLLLLCLGASYLLGISKNISIWRKNQHFIVIRAPRLQLRYSFFHAQVKGSPLYKLIMESFLYFFLPRPKTVLSVLLLFVRSLADCWVCIVDAAVAFSQAWLTSSISSSLW